MTPGTQPDEASPESELEVVREKGRLRLVVSVRFLRRSVAAEFDRDVLEPIAPPPRIRHAAALAGWPRPGNLALFPSQCQVHRRERSMSD